MSAGAERRAGLQAGTPQEKHEAGTHIKAQVNASMAADAVYPHTVHKPPIHHPYTTHTLPIHQVAVHRPYTVPYTVHWRCTPACIAATPMQTSFCSGPNFAAPGR